MAKRIRHVHAGPNEWVRVHRAKPHHGGDNSGCAMLMLLGIAILLLRGC